MYILHIETSTKVCSVALSDDQRLLDVAEMTEGMNHSAQLAPMIEQLLERVGLKARQLGAVSVSSGPGSYTGLRVGGSTAKAMSYSLGIPLIPVPTLQALAVAAFSVVEEADFALPMIDARRKEVYTTLVDRSLSEVWPVSSAILEPSFVDGVIPGNGTIVACGDGAVKLMTLGLERPHIRIMTDLQCSARHLVGPAWAALEKKTVADPLHFVPEYLKPPNITTPKNMGL